jgi:uncharacterized membrane protein
MMTRKQMICLAVLAIGDLALCLVALRTLPNRMRIRWDFDGEADSHRYSDPWEVAAPLVTIWFVAFVGALLLQARSNPDLQRSGAILGRGMIALAAFWVGNHLMPILCGFGLPINCLTVCAGSGGLLLAALSNWMTKFRRDDTPGWFRTSWMLKDDAVWERTNRLGGRIMVAHGLAIFLGAFFFPFFDLLVFFIVGLLATKLWSHVYSLWLYKKLHPGEWPN